MRQSVSRFGWGARRRRHAPTESGPSASTPFSTVWWGGSRPRVERQPWRWLVSRYRQSVHRCGLPELEHRQPRCRYPATRPDRSRHPLNSQVFEGASYRIDFHAHFGEMLFDIVKSLDGHLKFVESPVVRNRRTPPAHQQACCKHRIVCLFECHPASIQDRG